jgi:hypothetical protein
VRRQTRRQRFTLHARLDSLLRGQPQELTSADFRPRWRGASRPSHRALAPRHRGHESPRQAPQVSAENRRAVRLTPEALPMRRLIDAIGDLPMAQPGAHLCCQLISRRQERDASLRTAYPRFGPWGEVCGHPRIAPASLDRWRPHRVVRHRTGDSSRLRDTPQAG